MGRAHEPITTKIMFNNEVVRILGPNCLGCHRPGGLAPMSLATYEEARPWAKAIKEELLEKRMPPWSAVKGFGDFRNAPPLTLRDIDVIVNWVEGGAPKGDPKDLPPGPLFSNDWSLGAPDLILQPDEASLVAAESDAYRRFVLPLNLKRDRWLTAIDLHPGNGAVVHCATFYLETDRTARGTVATTLGTWVPGQKAFALPAGVAWRLPAGSRIGVRMHYRGSGVASRDRSAVGLYFAKAAVRKPLREILITDPDAVIPAGAGRYAIKADVTLKENAQAIAVRPYAHPLLISLEATAYRPDGTAEVLVWTRDSRFDWQPTYTFKRPVPLPAGTRIAVTAYFDNSEGNPHNPNRPPKSLRWSALTSDPLCAVLLTRR